MQLWQGRAVLARIVIVLTAVFIAGMAVIPTAAALALPLQPVAEATSLSLDSVTLRRLPLVQPDGPIERTFPDGVPMEREGRQRDDVPAVIDLVRTTGEAAGLGGLVPTLLDRSRTPWVQNEGWEKPGDPNVLFSYPYRYPAFDRPIAAVVTDRLARDKRSELIELSSALMYADRAAPAYSLLSRLREFSQDCDVQLNLAHVVAIGFEPRSQDVDREYAAAARACPGDPTPLAEWSRAIFARETRGVGQYRRWKLGELGQEEHAVRVARQAQQVAPRNPAGYLAEAGFLLEVADKYQLAGYRPFTARSMFRRALLLLDAAAPALPGDPSVSFGRVRALAGMGDDAAAVRLGAPLIAALTNPRDQVYAAQIVQQSHLTLGAAEEAADLSALSDQRTMGTIGRDVCRSLSVVGFASEGGTMGAPEPGWTGTCRTHLADATGGDIAGGADAVDSIDYIPRYREPLIDGSDLAVYAGRPARDEQGQDMARVLRGDWSTPPEYADSLVNRMNDQLRRLGRYEDAERLVRQALEHGVDGKPMLFDRLGETQYLRGDFLQAAASFRQAAEASLVDPPEPWPGIVPLDGLGAIWAPIKQAAALYRAGDGGAALALLDPLAIDSPPLMNDLSDPLLQEVARSTLAGTIRLRQADYDAAARDLTRARKLCTSWDNREISPCALGVQDNNLAIALLRSGHPREGQAHARAAIATDPANPLFAEGLANTLEEAGDVAAATQAYRDTIAQDATQATAHNNLGVLLAQSGDLEAATRHFRLAVGANAEYGVGWFNLALALQTTGDLTGFVTSQGAFGTAARLDTAFRGAEQEWLSDRNVYDPGIDLSKPLPKDWSAGVARKPIPVGFSFVVALAGVLNIARALISEDLMGRLSERLLHWRGDRVRLPRAGEIAGVTVCTGVTTWLIHQAVDVTGLWGWVAAAVGGLALSVAFIESRRVRVVQPPLHQASWLGMAIGTVGAPFGLGFAPVPTLPRGQQERWRGWWQSQAIIGLIGVLTVGLAWVSGVPMVRGLAQGVLIVLGSSLIPVDPYDGAALSRRGSLVVGVLLLGIGAVFQLNWL